MQDKHRTLMFPEAEHRKTVLMLMVQLLMQT